MNYASECMVNKHLNSTERETLTIHFKVSVSVSSSQTLMYLRTIWRAHYNTNYYLFPPISNSVPLPLTLILLV